MIHIPRPRVIPSALAAAAALEATRYQRALKAGRKGFAFSAYKEAAQDLERLFENKCAYCEFQYRGGVSTQVEHFRPKGTVLDLSTRKAISPGYPWLAATWDNLLPSCVLCNSPKWERIPARGTIELIGKAQFFPLANETRRATRAGDEKRERPLLLNPCQDRSERFFRFTEEGLVFPANRLSPHDKLRAETTIRILGLGRDSLVKARKSHAVAVCGYVQQILKFHGRYTLSRQRRDAEDLMEAWQNLQSYVGANKQFAALTQQLVRSKVPQRVRACVLSIHDAKTTGKGMRKP